MWVGDALGHPREGVSHGHGHGHTTPYKALEALEALELELEPSAACNGRRRSTARSQPRRATHVALHCAAAGRSASGVGGVGVWVRGWGRGGRGEGIARHDARGSAGEVQMRVWFTLEDLDSGLGWGWGWNQHTQSVDSLYAAIGSHRHHHHHHRPYTEARRQRHPSTTTTHARVGPGPKSAPESGPPPPPQPIGDIGASGPSGVDV